MGGAWVVARGWLRSPPGRPDFLVATQVLPQGVWMAMLPECLL